MGSRIGRPKNGKAGSDIGEHRESHAHQCTEARVCILKREQAGNGNRGPNNHRARKHRKVLPRVRGVRIVRVTETELGGEAQIWPRIWNGVGYGGWAKHENRGGEQPCLDGEEKDTETDDGKPQLCPETNPANAIAEPPASLCLGLGCECQGVNDLYNRVSLSITLRFIVSLLLIAL